MVEKYLKSNMCMLPWTSIETRPDGRYKPCCLYKRPLKDDNGKDFNTRTHSITEVMESQAMKKLRESFKRGEKPSACESCWKEEATGKISKRQHMWKKAPALGELHVSHDMTAPRFIDLKLGNICNLKCRICSAYSSSQWVNDMIKLYPDAKEKWKAYNTQGLWPREDNVFMKDLENHIEDIRFFEITGGEPLMIQEQFNVLKKCVDKGVAKFIEIHYNTNGTQFPEQAIADIWPHFKRIEIAFSIDDIGKRFEYQRYPAVWKDVDDNINKFKQSGMKNLSTQICTTINLFSVAYLDEVAHKVKEWNPDYWHINILHEPIEFDSQLLPEKIKHEIANKLLKCDVYKAEVQTAIDYMMHQPTNRPSDWHSMVKQKIQQIDALRKENFKTTFPFLNSLLKIYD